MKEKEYFEKYVSNTLAGTSNQTYFDFSATEAKNGFATGYAFYKIFKSGNFNYSLFFSNTVDGTFSDGGFTKCNYPCGKWQICGLSVAIANSPAEVFDGKISEIPLKIDGGFQKEVLPDEKIFTDPIELEVLSDEYLCVIIKFRGEKIPCHVENVILTYRVDGNGITPNKNIPLPSMIGVERKVKKKVAFLGDSITQGIGCAENSYKNYVAICAEILGRDYSFWNLGIGFGRAQDVASGGAWLEKAKHCDEVVVCFGVNDLYQVGDYDKIKSSFEKIADLLKDKRVIFQTIPPFDYPDRLGEIYLRLNEYIKNELKNKVFAVFDAAYYLCGKENPLVAKFGGHPNEQGCKIWGEALASFLKGKL